MTYQRLKFRKWSEPKVDRYGIQSDTWTVSTSRGSHFLGEVKWEPMWQGYAFFPRDKSLDVACLVELAGFLDSQNRAAK